MGYSIHPSAVVDKKAELGHDVEVGPYSVISGEVVLGDGIRVDHHVSIKGKTFLGEGSRFYPFCSIGEDPQDLKFRGEAESVLEIGAHAVVREFTSIHRGTKDGGGITRLGKHNLIMSSCHIAHDCLLGDHTIMATFTGLAGHVVAGDHVTFGGHSGVAQKIRIGSYVMLGGFTNLRLDVPPFLIVAGNDKARLLKVNLVRLQRCAFSENEIQTIQKVFRLFLKATNQASALEQIKQTFPKEPRALEFTDFIEKSVLGITH